MQQVTLRLAIDESLSTPDGLESLYHMWSQTMEYFVHPILVIILSFLEFV